MKLKCVCQIIFALIALKNVIADKNNEGFLKPMYTEDNIVNWQNLFDKINKILSETMKLSDNMEKLNTRQNNLENQMLDLKKGLEEHKLVAIQTLQSVQDNFSILDHGQTEVKTATVQLMQKIQQHSEDLKKVQTEQNATLNQLKGNEDIHFEELEKRQEEHKNATNQFMENVEKHFKTLEQRQSENIHNLTMLMNPWITILRRQDGSVNFNRNWAEYKTGFGNPDGEFFIGLDKLHAMTNEYEPKELLIVLRDFENEERYAKYDLFRIGNETEKYILKELGGYSGSAGDSLRYHKGMKFSTVDQDNDPSNHHVAGVYLGGWWYHNNYNCNLCGLYRTKNERGKWGIQWHGWKSECLKYATMKIRTRVSDICEFKFESK